MPWSSDSIFSVVVLGILAVLALISHFFSKEDISLNENDDEVLIKNAS